MPAPKRYPPKPAPALPLERATLTGLAERWGITRQRAGQLATDPTFPPAEPILGGPAVYLVDLADRWRNASQEDRVLVANLRERRREGGTPGWWRV